MVEHFKVNPSQSPDRREWGIMNNDWDSGYYCAVASLLRKEGVVDTNIRELFGEGGDPSKADPVDRNLFIYHGLMKSKAKTNESEGA